MARTRHWQAHVTYPWGGTMVFGVQAASQPAAILKALQIAAVPGIAGHLTVIRLYGRHHPLRAVSRAAHWSDDLLASRPERREGYLGQMTRPPAVVRGNGGLAVTSPVPGHCRSYPSGHRAAVPRAEPRVVPVLLAPGEAGPAQRQAGRLLVLGLAAGSVHQ